MPVMFGLNLKQYGLRMSSVIALVTQVPANHPKAALNAANAIFILQIVVLPFFRGAAVQRMRRPTLTLAVQIRFMTSTL